LPGKPSDCSFNCPDSLRRTFGCYSLGTPAFSEWLELKTNRFRSAAGYSCDAHTNNEVLRGYSPLGVGQTGSGGAELGVGAESSMSGSTGDFWLGAGTGDAG